MHHTKRNLGFLLLIVFTVVQLAATVDRDHLPADQELQERILLFKKGGVEKMIDTMSYKKEIVIEHAKSLLGIRHKMGGYSVSGVDCSGLVKLAHAQSGVTLPHSSHEQARYGKIVPADQELKRGDLVFFHSTYKTANLVTHSGIYLGENEFIHTSNSNGVSISALNAGYWQEHYLFATRLE